MEALQWIKRISQWVWGPWMLVLLVGTGVFLTIRLKAYPWRNLGFALRAVFQRTKGRRGSGDISPFQSLMTALAATSPAAAGTKEMEPGVARRAVERGRVSVPAGASSSAGWRGVRGSSVE